MSEEIITITLNPALDVTTQTAALMPDKKLRCSPPIVEPGGGGVNVSRAIRELGGDSVAFVLLAGAAGAQYRAMLDHSGISYRVWMGEGETRSSLTVMETAAKRHYRFVFPGPAQNPGAADAVLGAIRSSIAASCHYVVGSGSLPPGLSEDFYKRLATYCRDTGRLFILDSSREPLKQGLTGRPFLVKLNHIEAQELVGGPSLAERSAIELGRHLRARYMIDAVIITLGPDGAALVSAHEEAHIRPPAMEVECAVGAGDSFVAALVLRLQAGASLPQACRYGVAAAASAVTTPASQLCRRVQTEEIFDEISAGST